MDILENAIKMEVDGENFYREQALINKDNNLHPVFILLAKDEKKHANLIREKMEGIDSPLNNGDVASIENVFTDLKEFNFEKINPDQVSVFRKALKMEQDSIDFYKNLFGESNDDTEFFKFLFRQEEAHYKLFEEIIKFVNRPSEWVESAEFGVREEY